MALAANVLTSGSSSSASSGVTASVAPTSGNFVVIIVGDFNSGPTPNNPTITGAGTTWTRQLTENSVDANSKIHLFYAYAAGTGALTIDFGGQTQDIFKWAVIEFPGADLSSAAVQTAVALSSSTTTGLNATLGAFAQATNGTFGAIFDRASRAITVGSGFTELTNDSPTATLVTEYLQSNNTTVGFTWASAAANVVMIAMEIKDSHQIPSTTGAAFLTNFV